MASQLGLVPNFLCHTTTGGVGPLAAHTLHSTPTTRSWLGGRKDLHQASGSWQWTTVHTSAPSPRVRWSPSRISRVTGSGRRMERTSIPFPILNPGPSSNGRTSGSTTASVAATVGRCKETVHGWVVRGSRGKSGQVAVALPSRAQLSALSHQCVQVTLAVGSDQDK